MKPSLIEFLHNCHFDDIVKCRWPKVMANKRHRLIRRHVNVLLCDCNLNFTFLCGSRFRTAPQFYKHVSIIHTYMSAVFRTSVTAGTGKMYCLLYYLDFYWILNGIAHFKKWVTNFFSSDAIFIPKVDNRQRCLNLCNWFIACSVRVLISTHTLRQISRNNTLSKLLQPTCSELSKQHLQLLHLMFFPKTDIV